MLRDLSDRCTELVLNPLSVEQGELLLANLAPVESPELRDQVLRKAEGNPFFLEEVIRSLIDAGTIAQDVSTGTWRLVQPIDRVAIPDTLQGVVMSRLDRLSDEEKHVVRTAAVAGRNFLYRILREVLHAEEGLDPCLEQLQRRQLIREKNRIPEIEYTFKHAVTQEVAYESIPLQLRKTLHRAVGNSIGATFADRLPEFAAVLAYHFARAEEWEKAQEYLVKAGDHAGKIAADAEALVHYREAMLTYERVFGDRWDPAERGTLEAKIGEALFRRGEHHLARNYLIRALDYLGRSYPSSVTSMRMNIAIELARQVTHLRIAGIAENQSVRVADQSALTVAHVYDLMARIEFFEGNQQPWLLNSILEANWAKQHGYTLGMVKSYTALGVMCDFARMPWLAVRYQRRAMELAVAINHPNAMGHAYLGRSYHEHHILGHWDAAIQDYERAAQYFREAGELRWWGAMALMVGWLMRARGDVGKSLELCEHIVREGEDAGDPQCSGWGLQGLGRGLWQVGDVEHALRPLTQAIELFAATSDYLSIVEAKADIAQCHLRLGHLDRAIELFEEAYALIAARQLRGFTCTEVTNGRAEAYLKAYEQADDANQHQLLDRAKHACRSALNQVEVDRAAMPTAYRVQGTYQWHSGRLDKALGWWNKSEAAAAALGASWELGRTLLERGRFTNSPSHLCAAEQIFVDFGAKLELAATRDLMASSISYGRR
jgi:tetratricopeptide (TPR) repeat protein